MLNVVRSAVITSSHRTSCLQVGSTYVNGVCYRQASSSNLGETHEASSDHDKLTEEAPNKIDRSRVPVLDEGELDERFISGSGPGGQKVNKSVNCCQLRHRPTGIVVKVHQSRSLDQNRRIARQLMAQRLDNFFNGDESVESQSKRLALQKISIRESQAQKRRAMKEELKRILNAESRDES